MAGKEPAEKGGPGTADVQIPRWGRGESRDDHCLDPATEADSEKRKLHPHADGVNGGND
jgi:hypothetical protein